MKAHQLAKILLDGPDVEVLAMSYADGPKGINSITVGSRALDQVSHTPALNTMLLGFMRANIKTRGGNGA